MNTNEKKQALATAGKAILIVFLIFITYAVLGTFFNAKQIEKNLNKRNLKQIIADDTALISSEAADNSLLYRGDGSNYSLGPDDAKLEIIEFADFSCPYCRKSFSKIRELSLRYSKDIRFVFRDFPIMSDDSLTLALAARCSGEQGKFWAMHDLLFMNQGQTSEAQLATLAKKAGADPLSFAACLEAKKYENSILKDYDDAINLGLDSIGTPVWYINGTQVSGDIPEDAFVRIIEEAIGSDTEK